MHLSGQDQIKGKAMLKNLHANVFTYPNNITDQSVIF